MTLFDFQLLAEEQQIGILYEQGVYIGKRKEEAITVLLYQVEGFYVEVFYRFYRRHIEKLRSSAAVSILEPYLEQIDVDQLVGQC
ncbi:MAG TPA: hypothetical protein VFR58_13870 [Flavisolibacter sp.]|nr:hypothetical protein [Flavisolibacter sp.]